MSHKSTNKFQQHLSKIKDFYSSIIVDCNNSQLLIKKKNAEIALQHLEMLANIKAGGPVIKNSNPDCPPDYELSV